MKVVAVLLSLHLVVVLSDPIQLKECGGNENYPSKITVVDVAGCNMASTCEIKRGTNVTVKATFTTDKSYSTLRNGAYGLIGGVELPFPGFDSRDVCSYGAPCPTKPGVNETETVTLAISPKFPPIKALVKWRMYDESPNDPKDDPTKEMACILMVLQLV